LLSDDTSIAVALIEPQYDINVGYIARVMKNFGYNQLYVVNPHFGNEAVKFATHGKDVLKSAKRTTLPQLRKKFDVLVGTTAIYAYNRLDVVRDSIDAVRLSQIINIEREKNFCIILGRETSGLNNKELELCDLVVMIDTKTEYRTMNISHALAILLYEISKMFPNIHLKGNRRSKTFATKDEVNLLIKYLNIVADNCGYNKHKRPMLNLATQRLLAKGTPTSKEVMLLISLMRKSLTAIKKAETHRHAL
jgi:tRNA/rRNA methyltransferase